jgi:hypothetical protein
LGLKEAEQHAAEERRQKRHSLSQRQEEGGLGGDCGSSGSGLSGDESDSDVETLEEVDPGEGPSTSRG